MLAHAAKWTAASQATQVLAQLVQIVVLARLLLPADFGLMAIAMAITGFLSIYADLGISGGIIHHQDITDEQLSSLYLLNMGSGIAIATLLVLVAPVAGTFYRQPQVATILDWTAINVIISATGNQFRLLNQKHFQFRLMAIIDIVSTILGLVAALVSAWLGLGVYSLIAGMLVTTLAAAIANISTGLKYHRPKLAFNFNGIRKFLRYGCFQAAENSINYINYQIDVLLTGRMIGVQQLGGYSLAKNLCVRPSAVINPIFTRIAFPVMSKAQHDQAALKTMYLSGLRILSSFNFPIYVAIALLAEPLVRVLFGERWLDTVWTLRILAIYFLVRSTGNPVGALMMATGRVKRSFIWNLALFLFIPASIWLGASSGAGAIGVSLSLLVIQVMLVVPAWRYLVRPACGATLLEYLNILARPLAAAVLAGALMLIVPPLSTITILDLLARSLAYFVTYLAFSFWLNRPIIDLVFAFAHNSIFGPKNTNAA